MGTLNELFGKKLSVINIGTAIFQEDLNAQGIETVQVDWRPPAGGKVDLINALDKLMEDERVKRANDQVLEIIRSSNPVLVDMDLAINVIPGMTKTTILHSGPPITWDKMCGPMRGAVIGALIFEGLAKNEEEAQDLAASGKINFAPCHEHDAVGPMAGIISASMPVHIIVNKTYGNFAYCNVNEGLGKVLRFGAYSREVIDRLHWMKDELMPTLKAVLKLSGGIEIRSLIAQALHMGDECHNRNKAATSLFVRAIAPYFLKIDIPSAVAARVLEFIQSNDHYFLNLSMPACKATMDAAHGIPYSTIVTTMARNGVEFGIRVSGLPKDRWFTGPAQMIRGLFFPGYSESDANPDIGDSAITETAGIGGFAMGGAPAIVQFVGGTVDDAIGYSTKMYDITWGENPNYSIPNLNFRGTATGIDICKVVQTGCLPIINTGMAHKEAGIGQVGAGLVTPPLQCFEKALLALVSQMDQEEGGFNHG